MRHSVHSEDSLEVVGWTDIAQPINSESIRSGGGLGYYCHRIRDTFANIL